jgi:hypothetical protein
MPDTVLRAVKVTAGHPPTTVLRYICRLCQAVGIASPQMPPLTALIRLASYHGYNGYSRVNAPHAVEQAESEYHDRVAEGARSKKLLDVLEIYS